VLIQDRLNSSVTTTSSRQVVIMYAIRPINGIYHLVTRGGQDTLCGLRVSRIASDRTGNRLQLVDEMPSDRTICKHCERIKSQDTEQ
jgi:hypothetical protein